MTQKNKYDESPYESYPFPRTSPSYLRAIGILFGMAPPEVGTSRILELGCAGGGNILPLAIRNPNAQIVGIDLSEVQINDANKHKKALNLSNIEFHHLSIMDVNEEFGKFDYIICHGVYSWVPEPVREKILEICKKNLSENGIAYVSYNTLPGWNMVRSIRDMMMYHSENFNSPEEKVFQSRNLLNFIKESLEGDDGSYSKLLREEAATLSDQSDFYLLHDHLEETNNQFYFRDFVKFAEANKLQYLSDVHLPTMFVENMPQKAIEKLKTVNNLIRIEQYMDFISNRRFRSSLLCHAGIKIERAIQREVIKNLSLKMIIAPQIPLAKVDLKNTSETLLFYINKQEEVNVTTSSMYLKAILYAFAEKLGSPMSFEEITTAANEKIGGNGLKEIEEELLNVALKFIFKGIMDISTESSVKRNPEIECPEATKLVRHQIANTSGSWVTTDMHEHLTISLFDKVALEHMDGKTDRIVIRDEILKKIQKGELNIHKDGKALTSPEEIKKELTGLLNQTIEGLAISGALS